MDIQGLLKAYKMNRAKIKIAKLEVDQLQELLKGQLLYDESHVEVIEAMALKSPSSEGGSKTHKISQPTESIALSYLVEWSQDPPDRAEIKHRIAQIKSVIYGLDLDVQMVESALTALTDREKYIVHQLYFEGLSWARIIEDFEREFEFRDERTLRRYRKEALNRMDKVLRGG